MILKSKVGNKMRLWHEDMLTELPRQQLLGQHRECCALRGFGWNKKHATVNYIFNYSPYEPPTTEVTGFRVGASAH